MNGTSLPIAVLGRTGLEVTRLGFGSAISRKLPDSEWGQLLGAVLDSGINFVDTSDSYNEGRSESTTALTGTCLPRSR
ncbi:MAG: hypothetical protein OTJ97_09390 [SAR202 cluster bacterium]|nr:hypothetical protein [SAR202 cluster bacterium]